MYCQSNNWWRFCKILWPSQNIWTLLVISGRIWWKSVQNPQKQCCHKNCPQNSKPNFKFQNLQEFEKRLFLKLFSDNDWNSSLIKIGRNIINDFFPFWCLGIGLCVSYFLLILSDFLSWKKLAQKKLSNFAKLQILER